ncbi:MAG: hypothetical protein RIQ60_4454 [Pseudomonadota bacterium]|jgi:hypothetical protein
MTFSTRYAATLLSLAAISALPGCASQPDAVATTSVPPAPATVQAAAPSAKAAAALPAAVTQARVRFHNPAPRTGPGGSTFGARHGGLVLSDQGVDIELDAQPDQLDLWLREADKDVDLSGATGHITLLNGVDIKDAYLDPSDDKQRLTLRGEYKLMHGTRIVVRVTLADKRRLNARYLVVMLPPKASAPAAAASAGS